MTSNDLLQHIEGLIAQEALIVANERSVAALRETTPELLNTLLDHGTMYKQQYVRQMRVLLGLIRQIAEAQVDAIERQFP